MNVPVPLHGSAGVGYYNGPHSSDEDVVSFRMICFWSMSSFRFLFYRLILFSNLNDGRWSDGH